MNQMTQAMQMNVKYMQQDMLRDAAANRLAHDAQSAKGEHVGAHGFQHKLVAVAVALVTVLGVVVLF